MNDDKILARDRFDRRVMLQCMGWARTGALFALQGGVAFSRPLHHAANSIATSANVRPFTFLQISDTHVGFSKPANPDPLSTLRETIAKVKALAQQPEFIVHTGDITHLAKPEQFDTARSLLSELNLPIHFVPGEHDILDGTDPRPYLTHFGQGSSGDGWYSFDANGVHFVASAMDLGRARILGGSDIDPMELDQFRNAFRQATGS